MLFNATDQFIRGLRAVSKQKGVSLRKACLRASVHPETLYRFMGKKTDIKLTTLEQICEQGFGVSFHTVYFMGE